MKTASFFEYDGPGRISIARSAPRRIAPGYRVYRDLAPGPWFKSVSEEEYRRRYAVQLAGLDPREVFDALTVLGGDNEPVLLCWERKADLDAGRAFCHRRIVAQWLENALGVTVDER